MLASPLVTGQVNTANRVLMDKHLERCLNQLKGMEVIEQAIANNPTSPLQDELHFQLAERGYR